MSRQIDGFAAIGPKGRPVEFHESAGVAWYYCRCRAASSNPFSVTNTKKRDAYRLGYRVWPVRVELINGGPKK